MNCDPARYFNTSRMDWSPPNPHALAVLLLTLGALLLFTRERIALETLEPVRAGHADRRFRSCSRSWMTAARCTRPSSSSVSVTRPWSLCALMIAGQGLVHYRCTGAGRPPAGALPGVSRRHCRALTLLIGGGLSAFVNNVPMSCCCCRS